MLIIKQRHDGVSLDELRHLSQWDLLSLEWHCIRPLRLCLQDFILMSPAF